MSAAAASLPAPFPEALAAIAAHLPQDSPLARPHWGIICGSGLSGLADTLQERIDVPYSAVPGFPPTTVQGHKSSLAFGYLADSTGASSARVPVVAALGRFHLYEGHTPQACVLPVRLMKLLGAQAVVVTNASGGLNPDYDVGTIVAMHDHLSLPTLGSLNPLIGHNVPLGPRFPATSDAYDVPLRLSFFRAARELSLLSSVASGTYAYVSGPSYESRAECKFLRSAGADCVGMSTVPEILAARHAGLRVLGISLVTNKVVVTPYFDAKAAIEREARGEALEDQAGKDTKEAATHEEVLEVGLRRAEDVRRLVERTILSTPL